MLVKGYRKNIFRPECNSSFQSLHCIAELETDISAALPYLNSVLGGTSYLSNPPSVMFKVHGKLITVESGQIAVNALRDEAEADKILEWLLKEINEAWDQRNDIVPCYHGLRKPQILEILKLLPKTNCKQCGQTTCMVFASLVAEGAKDLEDCPSLGKENGDRLAEYLEAFSLS